MKNGKSIDVLNLLVGINNDRIEGYREASESTEARDLIVLFSMFEHTSLTCLKELIHEIYNLGGKAIEGISASGKTFSVWMDYKFDRTEDARISILNSCVYGEENAFEIYNNVLEYKSENLIRDQKRMIESQLILLKADLRTIMTLKGHLMETELH